jgi:hypothetical protein
VYSYSGTPTGEVGRADYDGSSAITHFVSVAPGTSGGNISNLTSDPKPFWFKNVNGDERLLVAESSYSSGPSYIPNLSLFSVYDAATLAKVWPTSANPPAADPVVNGKVQWSDLINLYAIDTVDDDGVHYIYGIDYDRHKVFRVINSSKTTSGVTNYDNYDYDYTVGYIYSDSIPYKFGVDLFIDPGATANDPAYVYSLFIRGEDAFGGTYDSSAIVKLPLDLDPFGAGSARTTDVGKNATGLKPNGDNIYVACIGGPQNYGSSNTDSVLQSVAKANLSVTTLLTNTGGATVPATEDTTDFRDIAISADGTQVIILKGRFDSDTTTFPFYLFGTDLATLDGAGGALISTMGFTSLFEDDKTGYTWALYYDNVDSAVWLARGNDLAVYTYIRGVIDIVTSLGMGNGNTYLAGTGFDLNAVTLYRPNATLRGAQDPNKASNSPRANATKAAGGEEEGEEK